MSKKDIPQQSEIQVNVPENLKRGNYSNASFVTVNQHEVIIDFGYLIPNTNPSLIEIVSRVNMTHHSAERFIAILQNAFLDFRNQQAKIKNEKKEE